jgi:hypothetical protein
MGVVKPLPKHQYVTGRAKSEIRRSRKGRDVDLQAYYDCLLTMLIFRESRAG